MCWNNSVSESVWISDCVWQMSVVTGGQQGHLHWSMWSRISSVKCQSMGFSGGASGKEPTCQCETHKRLGLIPGWERSLEERNGNPLQYFFLGNPMDRGAWHITVHSVANSQTWLKWLHCTYAHWRSLYHCIMWPVFTRIQCSPQWLK